MQKNEAFYLKKNIYDGSTTQWMDDIISSNHHDDIKNKTTLQYRPYPTALHTIDVSATKLLIKLLYSIFSNSQILFNR
jgi:hypothetical protein